MASANSRNEPPGRQHQKQSRSMPLNEAQLKLVGRARAQLRLPLLDPSGQPLKPEQGMPTAKALTSQLSRLVRMFENDEPYLSADERKKWAKEKSEIEGELGLFRAVSTWSKNQWLDYRAQFLCERGLDLDTAMMLRGQRDAAAVDAIREKAQKQIINLRLLVEHSPATSRVAVAALLKIAKDAAEALNDLAVDKELPVAVRVAQESETWPVLAADHPTYKKSVKAVLQKLDVGSRYRIRIEQKARAKLDDPAGRLTALIIERLTTWRDTYQRLRDDDWFWEKLPDWAKEIIDLPDYEKLSWQQWWSSAKAMLEYSYCGQGRVPKDYLDRILKDKSGKPLSYRRAKMSIRSRVKGQAPT